MICTLDSLINIFNPTPHIGSPKYINIGLFEKRILLCEVTEKNLFKRNRALSVMSPSTWKITHWGHGSQIPFTLYIIFFLKKTFKKLKTTKAQAQESGNAFMMDS